MPLQADSVHSATIANDSASPFGLINDPASINGSIYGSPLILINQVLYQLSNDIFTYSSFPLDSSLQYWRTYNRQNLQRKVPTINRVDTRSGAANLVLGFANAASGPSSTPLSVLVAANSFAYMQPTLSAAETRLPINFQVSAVDYDEVTESVVSNYLTPISVARKLRLPVLTPLSSQGPEIQHMALVSSLLSLTEPAVHLFDGPSYIKNYNKINGVLSSTQISNLYGKLLNFHQQNWSNLSTTKRIEAIFSSLNQLIGTTYGFFNYVGHSDPETVFVVYGSNESEILNKKVAEFPGSKVGVISIRVPLPFNIDQFVATIPKSTKKLVVVGQIDNNSKSSWLKSEVNAALLLAGKFADYSVSEFTYPLNFVWSPIIVSKIISSFYSSFPESVAKPIDNTFATITANSSPKGEFLFWSFDNAKTNVVSSKISHSLSLDDSIGLKYRARFDNKNGAGIVQSQIVSSLNKNYSDLSNLNVDSSDITLIDNIKVLDHFDVVSTTKPGSAILIVINSDIPDVEEKLPAAFKKAVAINRNQIHLVNTFVIGEDETTQGLTSLFVILTAWWRIALPQLGEHIVHKLLQSMGAEFELLASVVLKLVDKIDEQALSQLVTKEDWLKEEEGTSDEQLPFFPVENAFEANPRQYGDYPEIADTTYVDFAKRLAFKEAYLTKTELRPDLPVKNFVVKVQENRRLTPSEYSRNIFHIEFDITGTGLTYDIGEALGVHGRNNEKDVEEFIQFLGVKGDDLIEVPNKEYPSVVETRTVKQTLTETLDFLGKPPKKFYEGLSEFAEETDDKEKLQYIGGSDGKEELKKRQDVQFLTYFDILKEFKSAKPAVKDLISLIAPLKRREYSIASSQKLHPNAVHLLVVVNDWVDDKGVQRFGHCSTYLSDLQIGDELVVSVKPSVMKLPPLSTQPIVMSGLGTGLAPFKAFIEEKIWQKQQGMEIGDIYLYLGSRHKKEEYLYGELWEAYMDAGIVTHVGAAFSRDQVHKIYIQDKIRENIDELASAIVTKNGSFYLCGPTWPVPDITACLEDILTKGAALIGETVDAAKEVEEMKETGRYVLEVY